MSLWGFDSLCCHPPQVPAVNRIKAPPCPAGSKAEPGRCDPGSAQLANSGTGCPQMGKCWRNPSSSCSTSWGLRALGHQHHWGAAGEQSVLGERCSPNSKSHCIRAGICIKCRRCKDMCGSSAAHLSAASPGNLLCFCSLQNKITVQKQELLIKISKTNHYLTRMGWIQSYCWGTCGRSFTLGNNMCSLSFSRGSWRSSVLNLPETWAMLIWIF